MTIQPDPQLIADVEAIYHGPTSHRDPSPIPVTGSAPPVAQPGRPPMSQRATDASAVMLAAGIASLPIGGSISAVLWTAGHVDPMALALIVGAPVALLTALSKVFRSAKATVAAPPAEHHHHYAGPVRQDHTNVSTTTRGVVARTSNQFRR